MPTVVCLEEVSDDYDTIMASPKPNLNTLPTELVEHIFDMTHEALRILKTQERRKELEQEDQRWGFLGYDQSFSGWDSGFLLEVPRNEVLFPIRSVCKSLYFKTLHIFYKHNMKALTDDTFVVSHTGLGRLLWLASQPFLLQHLTRICLVRGNEISSCAPYFHKQFNRRWLGIEHFEGLRLWREERSEWERSPDCYHILKKAFDGLTNATRLKVIELSSAYEMGLAALDHSQFGRRICILKPDAAEIVHDSSATTWSNLTDHTRLVKGLDLNVYPSFHGQHHGYTGEPNYRPELQRLWATTPEVEELTIRGCCDAWFWRTCHACKYFWRMAVHDKHYGNLRTLTLRQIYVDGGALRSFLARHHQTLTDIDFLDVKLTCGSWRKIFHTLRRASLSSLRLAALYQKPKEGRLIASTYATRRMERYQYIPHMRIQTLGDNVQLYLGMCIGDFAVHVDGRYQEVDLPLLEGLGVSEQSAEEDWVQEGFRAHW